MWAAPLQSHRGHRAGIKLLIDDGNVFGCYSNIDETIYHSELGSSDAILRAGYNLGSFMVRRSPVCRCVGLARPACGGSIVPGLYCC